MPSFKHRSYQRELLDKRDIPFGDIRRNMQELDFINTWLGGHGVTLKGAKRLLTLTKSHVEPISVVEIGCGGGDNLRVIRGWAIRNKIKLQLTGVDINKECITYACQQERNSGINFIHSDYREVKFDTKPHVVFSSLFCHHFTDDELREMLLWMKGNSSTGFFINDLQRHPLAYYSIRILTGLFSKSYLVKNDAPLSVLRGFIKTEWKKLFADAQISSYRCQWCWAFRWLIIYQHGSKS